MSRTLTYAVVLLVALLTCPTLAARAEISTTRQTNSQVSATDASPFIGDWTLAMQGPNGPATLDLAVKVENDKVVGEIKSAELPAQAITDVTKVDKSLVLRYSFDYQGNAVPTVVSLMPADEGKTNAQIDFAGGAYVMSGTATKKEKAK